MEVKNFKSIHKMLKPVNTSLIHLNKIKHPLTDGNDLDYMESIGNYIINDNHFLLENEYIKVQTINPNEKHNHIKRKISDTEKASLIVGIISAIAAIIGLILG